jgi:uncharacterized protein
MTRARELCWRAGAPVRGAAVGLIRLYQATIGRGLGARCRFHPTCSAYAVGAIEAVGVVRGTALAVWRLARCSPLSAGGVDYPPRRYDGVLHAREAA